MAPAGRPSWILLVLILNDLHAALSTEALYEMVDRLLVADVYNSKVRPGVQLDTPLIVTVDIYINTINQIDEVNMAFTLNIYFRQRWRDPRLASTELNKTLTLDRGYYTKLWVPDAFFSNEIDGHFNDITVPNRLLILSPDGTLMYSQRLTLTLGCQMDLAKYPLDNQTCGMHIESYGYTTDDLIFKWREQEPMQMEPGLQLPEFLIVDSSVVDCTKVYVTGSFTCLKGSLNLQRQFDYYLTRTFLPSGLIVSLSWVSFWIDAHSVPARVTLGLLTVLTITTQSGGISQRLPRVSYLKAIDIWMTTCLAVVYVALIEFSIVNVLSRRGKGEEKVEEELSETQVKARAENASKEVSPSEEVEGATQLGNIHKAKAPCWHTVLFGAQTNSQPKPRSSFWRRMAEDKALMVDMVSRLLFPLFFAIFNIVYWSYFKAANENI